MVLPYRNISLVYYTLQLPAERRCWKRNPNNKELNESHAKRHQSTVEILSWSSKDRCLSSKLCQHWSLSKWWAYDFYSSVHWRRSPQSTTFKYEAANATYMLTPDQYPALTRLKSSLIREDPASSWGTLRIQINSTTSEPLIEMWSSNHTQSCLQRISKVKQWT